MEISTTPARSLAEFVDGLRAIDDADRVVYRDTVMTALGGVTAGEYALASLSRHAHLAGWISDAEERTACLRFAGHGDIAIAVETAAEAVAKANAVVAWLQRPVGDDIFADLTDDGEVPLRPGIAREAYLAAITERDDAARGLSAAWAKIAPAADAAFAALDAAIPARVKYELGAGALS